MTHLYIPLKGLYNVEKSNISDQVLYQALLLSIEITFIDCSSDNKVIFPYATSIFQMMWPSESEEKFSKDDTSLQFFLKIHISLWFNSVFLLKNRTLKINWLPYIKWIDRLSQDKHDTKRDIQFLVHTIKFWRTASYRNRNIICDKTVECDRIYL